MNINDKVHSDDFLEIIKSKELVPNATEFICKTYDAGPWSEDANDTRITLEQLLTILQNRYSSTQNRHENDVSKRRQVSKTNSLNFFEDRYG